jgi:hypothetical protein
MLIVADWGDYIDDHNRQTISRYNAHTLVQSRGSTLENDAVPGCVATSEARRAKRVVAKS